MLQTLPGLITGPAIYSGSCGRSRSFPKLATKTVYSRKQSAQSQQWQGRGADSRLPTFQGLLRGVRETGSLLGPHKHGFLYRKMPNSIQQGAQCRSARMHAQYVEIVTTCAGGNLKHPVYRAKGLPVSETLGDWHCSGFDMQLDRPSRTLLVPSNRGSPK